MNGDKLAELEERSIATMPPPSIVESRTNAIANYHPFNDLHRISLPTLLVCAEDDFLTPPYFTQRIAGEIRQAEVQWIARGGHACSQTVPDEFNKVVLDFWPGLKRRTALRLIRYECAFVAPLDHLVVWKDAGS
jgi:aminoacrylate hydrolase